MKVLRIEVGMVKPYKMDAVLTLAALVWVWVSVPALADVQMFRGTAVNSAGEVAFIEEHTIRFNSEEIASMSTVFYDADSNRIGELVSDLSRGMQVDSYDFKDDRRQYKDGAKVLPEKIMMYSKKAPDADFRKKYLQREPGQIVGHGFHLFIQENMGALTDGEVFHVKLVLPAHMDQFKMRVYSSNIENGRMRVRIDVDNWFLRLFAPHVEAVYDVSSRQLLSYKGVSVIADESGKTVPVTISYSYSQPDLVASSRVEK
ncbi:MAG: hypothetical protein PVG35_09920 [Desulfobacterales bacterium]|jgi:hypothetical protein